MTPYAMVPQPLPLEALLNRYLPPPPSAPTPGSAMAAPPGPSARLPGWGSLRAIGAGLVTPFGIPEPTYQVQDVPSLSGRETLPTPVASADLGAAAAEDPAGAFVGQSVGLGPAFRLAGAGAGAIAASPPAQWLGRQLARPAVQAGVTAPLAVGGASLATAGDTQAPTPASRETGAQQVLDQHRAALTKLGEDRASLQTRIGRYDPENIVNLNEQQIKEAQAAVGATPDGRIGPQTRAAIAEYRRRLQAQIDALAPRETTLRGDIKTAEDALAEARRLDLQDAGSARVKAAEPGWLEQYGPYMGLPLGFAAGYFGRNIAAHFTRRGMQRAADDAEGIASQFGQGTVPERIGRLNEFWTGGSQRTAPPFGFAPGGRPFPWTSQTHEIRPGMMGGHVQREALTPDQLYRPSRMAAAAPTASTTALGGLEAVAGHYGAGSWNAEVEAAQKAVEASPTEANVQRLVRAREWAALFSGLENFGRMTAVGGLSAAVKNPMRDLPRPRGMGRAETERGNIDMLLTQAPPTRVIPPGAYQDAGGRWRVGSRWIANP